MAQVVVKRDGTEEKFSLINVAKVAVAAGLTPDQAKVLASRLDEWVKQLGKEKISSIEIRDQMILELEKVNTNAAELYKWYEQTKES